MRTRRAISTISYNTDSFLCAVLQELLHQRKIEFWCYINHLPEEDETKAHKHLFIIPSSELDTFWLQEKLREPDVTHPDLPLGIIHCVSSKFADWYLYALHDADYLASKMEVRKYHYEPEEIITSCPDTLHEFVHMSDFSKIHQFTKFREMVFSNVPFRDMIKNGFIPPQQVRQYKYMYDVLKNRENADGDYTYRGVHNGHM